VFLLLRLITQPRTGGGGFQEVANRLDLFVGGDMGLEWGVNFNLSSTNDKGVGFPGIERKQSGMGVGLGVIMGDLTVHTNLALKDESNGSSTAAGDKWEGQLGLNVGATYKVGAYTAYGDYKKGGHDATVATVKTETSSTNMRFGFGRVHELSGGRWFYDVNYYAIKTEIKVTAGKDEIKSNRIPLTVGFEADANSWLTVRGSVTQSLRGSGEHNRAVTDPGGVANNKTVQDPTTTAVAVGLTLNFGKLKIDGTVGANTDDHGAVATAEGPATGELRLDELMSRVSLHYWF